MPDPDVTGDAWRHDVNERAANDGRGREALGRLIETGPDPAEVAYYEAMSDPQVLAIQSAQRSYAGQYRRRVRRRQRDQHRSEAPNEPMRNAGATDGVQQ